MKKKLPRPTMLARIGAIASAVMLGSCLAAGTAFADTTDDFQLALPELLQSGLHTDYVSTDSADLAATYPSALDLRHYNGTVTYNAGDKQSTIEGGINYVTPVKLQNPFGSCWAFACTAASESSMLSTLDANDDGEMNGSVDYEKAASGEAGAIAHAASDLSERHLAYFVFSHPTKHGLFSSQAGEGVYLVGNSSDTVTKLNCGGMLFLGMSLYSTGIGPVAESVAPYTNDEGWIEVPTDTAPTDEGLVYAYFLSYEDAQEYVEKTWTDESIAEFNAKYATHITKSSVVPRISKRGTWAVDGDLTYQVVAELDSSNIIASTKNADGSLTADEMAQCKRELSEGHPLSIAFVADQSRPGDTITSANSYMNTATWAQYTYDTARVNHAVTIVGYDDNYDASNFTHNVYKQDETGAWVVDEEKTALTTPAGNGAWIVKNSWGTLDQEDPLQQMNWGINGSGYFYLSYYDKNVSLMESFEYDLSDEAQGRSSYLSYQYDLANVTSCNSIEVDGYCMMANVFDGPDDGENPVVVRDLGCLTGAPNATVTLSVYVMDDDADVATTIEESTPYAILTETFDSAGFHRMHLDLGALVSPGQKFAVVQSTLRDNGKYEYTFDYGMNEAFANAYNGALSPIGITALGTFTTTVINDGESLIKIGDTWSDMQKLIPSLDADATAKNNAEVQAGAQSFYNMALVFLMAGNQEMYEKYMAVYTNFKNFNATTSIDVDNWTIKAYADEIAIPTKAQAATTVRAWGQKATFTCDKVLDGATYQWQWSKDGGETWSDCTVGSGANTNAYTLTAAKYRAGYLYRCVVNYEDIEAPTAAVGFDLQLLQARATSTLAKKAGGTASLVCACSASDVTYQWQWRKNDTSEWKDCTAKSCSDPTAAVIQVKAKSYRADYQYRCVVSTKDGIALATNAVNIL